jgi:hypothetical protein
MNNNMMRFLGLSLFSMFFGLAVLAQSPSSKGTVRDEDKLPVMGATVSVFSKKDSSQAGRKNTVTDAKGRFQLPLFVKGGFIIEISSIGYEIFRKEISSVEGMKDLAVVSIKKQGKDLQDVTIVAKTPPVILKGDTSEFSASQFKVNPDATSEDLIKKMPGITVARDGTVTAQGEQVKKVTIDGKDFFGDDASAALKNMPSDVVDKIQVFDKLSDQAQLTGFDDGNSIKTINIVTKSTVKNGQFGRFFGGGGTDDRYSSGGNISFFKGNRRISLVGNFNNINQQNFASQDLLGLTSSGGGGRGGGGGGRGGGGMDNFMVGQANGINKTNAFGINYSNQFTKKLLVTGSYFYNYSSNNNESLTNTETFFNPKNQFSLQNSQSLSKNNNHRINLRVEYKIDSANSIFIVPSINFQNNNTSALSSAQNYYGADDSLNTSFTNRSTDRLGYNIRNNIGFRHAFPKKGRSFSFGINTVFTKNDGESYTDAKYRFFKYSLTTDSVQNQFYQNPTDGNTIGANITYTEPVGKKAQLQFEYLPSIQKNETDQQTYLFDGSAYSKFAPSLSNQFANTITTNNTGVTYRLGKSRDEQISFGVNLQHSTLESERILPTSSSVHQGFSNILPNAMWRKKINQKSNINLFYRGSTIFPTVSQLQDVVNLSNPLRVSSGNPSLKQSFTQFVSFRYTFINSKTSRSFFTNLYLQTASDFITNATYIATADSIIQQNIVIKRGSQLTKSVNLDGYKSLRTYFTYSMPVIKIKTTINFSTGFSYAKLPGLANYNATTTNNYTYTNGIVFASNISQFVDFNISYNSNYSVAKINAFNSSTTKYVNGVAGAQLNLLNKKGWFLQNDVSNQSYSGLTDGLNQSYWLWNVAVGKKLWKKKAAEIKLSVFDLLKQNQSIIRTVTGAYIEDSRNQVLQQYFMLTFSYSLKNFGVAAKPAFNGGGSNGQYRDGMRPGGGGSGYVPGF